MPTPRLYHVERFAIALLCGYCFSAVEKTGGMLHKLRKHNRFRTDLIRTRGRLSRFINLHSTLPDDDRFDLIEERLRIELLTEDQPVHDPFVEENVLSLPTETLGDLREHEIACSEREPGDDADDERIT